ncbi:soluble cytochrome b562 [Pseudoalteromonas ulvae UL12]|uniref:cytochrome b562 n=1 Tax=Pseudoalteromonas ulvae TaxID=107327 RepID=UPI00186B8F77|nr:cytochrome b562 [Pseudoalteromonas ulvae]MBE0366057.1 soluble cytochrome b562 [Pseudoalteromonas ulvae UL12]
MKYLILVLILVSQSLVAQNNDLSLTMKNMGLSYKNAIQATDPESLETHLIDMLGYLKQSEQFSFNDKKEASLEGLKKVANIVKQAQAFNQAGEFDKAILHLKPIDKLRKKYHKLHEPSFWDLLFGQ